MKRVFQFVLLALALLAGAPGPAAAGERITLMVGGIDKIIYLPVKLAEQLGYFTAEGLEVELHSEYSGSQGVDELLVGAAQGVVGFYDHVIYMQSMGKSVVSLIQFAQAPGEVELVSAQAQGVRTMADLKGLVLGVTGLGSSTQFLSRYLALQSGLRLNQVTFVPVGTGDVFIARPEPGHHRRRHDHRAHRLAPAGQRPGPGAGGPAHPRGHRPGPGRPLPRRPASTWRPPGWSGTGPRCRSW